MKAVYIIAEEGADLCKIGITNNPAKRLTILQTGQPRRLILHAAWLTDCSEQVERAAHEALLSRRLSGEWFSVSKEHASFVIGLVCGKLNVFAEPVVIPPSRREVGVRARAAARTPVSPLQAWRFENNHSARSMAAAMGDAVAHTTLTRVEKGEARPGRDLLKAIVAFTGLTPAQVLEPWFKLTEEAA